MKKLLLILSMLLSSTAFSATSNWGDWETGTVTGSGNHNWWGRQTERTDSFVLLNDGTARQGNYYAKVMVNPGDHGIPQPCCERSMVLGMQTATNNWNWNDEDVNSGTVRYTFSVKFDPTWQNPVNSGVGAWMSVFELHANDNSNADWMINAACGTNHDHFCLQLRTGDIDTHDLEYIDFANTSLNKGKWIDFIITVKYANDNTGSIIIQRRDEGQTSFTEMLNLQNRPTLHYSGSNQATLTNPHYLMAGLYRNASNFPSILYLDGFTREVVSDVPPPPTSLPDVIITSITYSNGVFSSTVTNQGTAATPSNTTVDVGYSVDGVYRTWGISSASLAAGASVNIGTGGGSYIIPNGVHNITAYVDDDNKFAELSETNNQLSQMINVGAADTTPPTVSMTAPVQGATVSGFVTISANAVDNIGVAGVQFKLDGVNLGTEDTSSPYSSIWDTTTSTECTHILTSVARDAAGNTDTSSDIGVMVDNLTNIVIDSLSYANGVFTGVIKKTGGC